MEGVGRIIEPSGVIYVGGIDKWQKHGPGQLTKKFKDGSEEVFEGVFQKDYKEGIGYTIYPDGSTYQG